MLFSERGFWCSKCHSHSPQASRAVMLFSPSPSQFWHRNVINSCLPKLRNVILAFLSPDPPPPGINPLLIIPRIGLRAIQTSEIWTWIFGENVDFCDACKMDTDYDNMTVVELRALMREHGLRGYSRLRKA